MSSSAAISAGVFGRVLGDLAHPLTGALGPFQAVVRFLDGRLGTGNLALQGDKVPA